MSDREGFNEWRDRSTGTFLVALHLFLGAISTRSSHAQTEPCQIAKLLPADIQENDAVGGSIAATADIIVAGAAFHLVGDDASGRVFVFRKVDGVWRDDAALLPQNATPGGNFGRRVSIDTSTGVTRFVAGAAVARCREGSSTQLCGEVFVYSESGSVWSIDARLTPDEIDAEQTFGWDVDFEENRIAVGAPETSGERGAAYIFESDGASWQRSVRLQALTSHYFGSAVELEDEYLFVGAYLDNEFGSNVGAVYVFKHDISDQWNQVQKLVPSDARPEGRFGTSIAASGGVLIIGASGSSSIDGAAYVFELETESESWIETAILLAPAESEGVVKNAFGTATDLKGNLALIGAGSYAVGAGAAFAYRKVGSEWMLESSMTPTPDGIISAFGSGVAILEDSFIVGAGLDWYAAQQAGSVNIFLRSEVLAGNVNTGDGSAASDVLFVNGSAGNRCNVVNVQSGVSTPVSLTRAPQGNGAYAFWIDDFRKYAGDSIQYMKGGTTYDLGSGVKALPINNSVAPGSVPCPLTFPVGWTSQSLGGPAAGRFCLIAQPGFPRAPTSFNVIFPPGNFILGGLVTDQNSINSPALNVSIANWIFVRSQ